MTNNLLHSEINQMRMAARAAILQAGETLDATVYAAKNCDITGDAKKVSELLYSHGYLLATIAALRDRCAYLLNVLHEKKNSGCAGDDLPTGQSPS